jgi:hypothetical protein
VGRNQAFDRPFRPSRSIGHQNRLIGWYDPITFSGVTTMSQPSPSTAFIIPSNLTAPEFGKVVVRRQADGGLGVEATVMMEPQGIEAEGWQTGVAIDSSASMKVWYGLALEGKIPPDAGQEYMKNGWVDTKLEDGRKVQKLQPKAVDDAIKKGYLKFSENIVQPLAREFLSYLAGNLDSDGGTTLIYWACKDGSAIEVVGDFDQNQCKTLELKGAVKTPFGQGTFLAPAVQYFVDRFADAKRGMYVFLTDGRIDDLQAVKDLTMLLAQGIAEGSRNSVKCVLVGMGTKVDEAQMIELDNLDTGVAVDIWDHKIAKDMRALVEIFSEVVGDNQLIAPTGAIFDDTGAQVKLYSDGLPARIIFTLPSNAQWFELEVGGNRVRQAIVTGA